MAKAAYKEITTVGTIEWPRLFEFDRDKTGYNGQYEECEGAYTLNQVLSKEEFDKLKKAGSMKKPKQDRLMGGEIVIKFERKHLVKNKAGDIIAPAGGAPKVVGPNGKAWDVERDGLIGNGTLAEVTNLVTPFTAPDGSIGHRTSLTKIKIIELVPYIRETDEEEAA